MTAAERIGLTLYDGAGRVRLTRSAALCGAGSFGRVYTVFEADGDDEALAGLVFKEVIGDDKEFRALVAAQELRNLLSAQRISSAPRLKSPETLYTPDGSPGVLMERAKGSPLDRLMREGFTFSSEDIRKVAKGIFKTIDELAVRGEFHGDMKPGNFCYAQFQGVFSTLDWGMKSELKDYAKGLSEIDRKTMFTLSYCPLEWLQGKLPEVPDLWSAVCTLVELSTGQILFPGVPREGDDSSRVQMAVIYHVLGKRPLDADLQEIMGREEIATLPKLCDVIEKVPEDLREFVQEVLQIEQKGPLLEKMRGLLRSLETFTFGYQIPKTALKIEHMKLFIGGDQVWKAPTRGEETVYCQIPAAESYRAVWLRRGERMEQEVTLVENAVLYAGEKGKWHVMTADGIPVKKVKSCTVM